MKNENLATQIFGSAATLSDSEPVMFASQTTVDRLISEPLYFTMIILFAILYMLWLPHIIKGKNIRWARLKRNIYYNEDKKQEVISAPEFSVAIITWALSMMMIILLSLRIFAQYSTFEMSGGWQKVFLLGGGSLLGILSYGWIVLKVSGYLTIQGDFIKELLSFRGQMLFMCVLLLSPLLVLGGFANAEQGNAVLQIALCVIVIFVVIFIRHTFLLFVRQNFSILHWFLYLCAVEIFPLTFIWAFVTRGY